MQSQALLLGTVSPGILKARLPNAEIPWTNGECAGLLGGVRKVQGSSVQRPRSCPGSC